MSSLDRSESWTAVALDALVWLRPVTWAAFACLLWFTVVAPAQADTFPFPPPGTGCPPNTSCIPGGGLPGGGNPGQCTPNPNGNPGCNGAGNPVDIITGNKYQHEIDLAPLPGEMGLHFSRHYNSNSTHRGLTGVGWRSTYEIVLVDLGSALQIIDADGRRLTFDRHTQHPGLCVGARPEDGRVIVDEGKDKPDAEANGRAQKNREVTYRWQRLDGSEYTFHSGSGDGHPLQSIRAASGATMTLTYLGGALDSVRDAQGRTLRFIYARPLAAGSTRHRMLALSAIDTPVGRVSYKHDEFGRLQSAMQPNGLVHRYHYEPERQGAAHNTWALTGISVESVQDGKTNEQRLATYVYDSQGRTVRTQNVGVDDLTLTYGPKAATTITNATGARTVYRHALVAGQWQTVEAIGPGCPTCPASNVRYRYRIDGPQAGQLEATLQLDAQGKALQQQRVSLDAWGRPTQIYRIDYASVNGKPSARPPRVLLRAQYSVPPPNTKGVRLSAPEYAALWRPHLITRTSVVPGQEHSVAVSYNNYLQPLMITESGASPLDANGNSVVTALTRSTTYRYAQIAGVSRLSAIDGPLSGSADTTTLHYDELGQLRLVQHPVADLQERYAYDDAGRLVWHRPVDAVDVRTAFDASGEPTTWQRGPARVVVTRDQLGRPLRIDLPDGEVRWIGHDGPGGLGALVSNRGWGHWRIPTLQAAQHVLNVSGPAGASAAAYASKASASDTGGSNRSASAWGAVEARRDDFGRLVALRTEATGLELRGYDAANRLLERRFADGGIWRYERDTAGRIVAHTVMAPDAASVTTRVHWFGAYPIRIEHPNETEARRFDANGRVAERAITRASGVQFTERFAYDAADRLTSHELPEGGTLRYTWGVGAQLRTIDYQSPLGRTQSLIEPLPTATGLETPFVAKGAMHPPTDKSENTSPAVRGGYRYGNGIEARWQLDTDGQLAALEHRSTARVGGAQASWWSALLASIPAAWASADRAPIAGWRYDYDPLGRMAVRADVTNNIADGFGYDGAGRLVIAAPALLSAFAVSEQHTPHNGANSTAAPNAAATTREYYAYDARGDTLGRRVDDIDHDFRTNAVKRGAGGLPERIGNRTLTYSADRRLTEVLDSDRLLARYHHNAYGERISKHDPARGTTDYLYARQQQVAETVPDRPDRLARRYVYAHGVPVAAIDYPQGQALLTAPARDAARIVRVTAYARSLVGHAAGRGPVVAYVHANEIGAPVAVTDSKQRVQWRAQYRVYGEAQITTAATANPALTGYTLNLRLPGQQWDVETGWHDNYLRTYDPARGQYLEPDPLGPTPLTQPFSYADHNPLIYADPLGLILFAFDGTGNDESDPRTLSNVVFFRDLYLSDNRRFNYITGPGTLDPGSGISPPLGDAGFSFSGLDRVGYMVRYLNAEANRDDDNTPMDIDIIGFSRGAAQAREFANRIVNNTRNGWYSYRDPVTGQQNCQRVNFRFMGLWDTVLSTHTGTYNLGIPDAFGHVSHAVALNEYRGQTLRQLPLPPGAFRLESIQGRAVPSGASRIERGFLGSHSDIGGGFEQGDLAKVALVWMIEQARAAGVQMANGPGTITAAPALHDKSNSLLRNPGRPTPQIEDRQVRFANGSITTQRAMTGTTMTYSDTETYIAYLPDRGRQDYVTGIVDMRGYLQWLNANGYGINLTVQ